MHSNSALIIIPVKSFSEKLKKKVLLAQHIRLHPICTSTILPLSLNEDAIAFSGDGPLAGSIVH